MGWRIRSVIIGIKNLLLWLPIIWSDRNYDWEFLARVMEFKLRNMSRYMRTQGATVGAPRAAKQILICAELLSRICEDDPHGLPFRMHEDRMNSWVDMLGDGIKKIRRWWD